MRIVNRVLGVVAILFYSSVAMANCTIAGSFSFDVGKITVQRDVAVGQPISDWIYTSQGIAYKPCVNFNTSYAIVSGVGSYNSHTSLKYNGSTVFNSNLSGVGFVLEGRTSIENDSWSGWTNDLAIMAKKKPPNVSSIDNQARIKFIKTGNIISGSLGNNAGIFYAGTQEDNVWSPEISLPLTGSILNVACTITTPDINLFLGKYRKSDFTGTGSTTAWQDFNIDLNCDKTARINVRIDGTADSSAGSQGVMKLDSSPDNTVATGVGIQMGYRPDNSLVQFGQEKYYWTSSSGGYENIQLRARYYQTAQAITPGQANGTATFTLTYK